MKGVIISSMQIRVVIVCLAALLIIFGIVQLKEMPIGVFPEFAPVYVEVQTEALGLSAEEVEEILTVALEQDLFNGIAYLDEIWSESMPGLSRVVCVFEPGTDPMIARQVVAERLTQAHALPNVSKPPIMLQPYSSTGRVMKVALTPASQNMSLIDLSVLARWTIQPYLMGVHGVANVSIWGQRKRQLQVQVDPEVLHANGVTLQDIIKTTGEALWVSPLTYLNSSTPGTGGFFDTPNQRLGVRHVLPISSPDELAQVPVYGKDLELVLGDVSTVVENHQPLIGDAIINGNQGLLLVVEKFPWASTIDVAEAVEDAMENLGPGLTGVSIDTEIYQPARYLEASFNNLQIGLAIGLSLALIALIFFFYTWKAALVSFFAITFSLIAGLSIIYLSGAIVDMMIIAGLVAALLIIIDDAITTVDNIRHKLGSSEATKSDRSTASLVLEAVTEVRSPLLFASGILVLALLPFIFIRGIAGEFLQPLAITFLLAILISIVTAVVVVPALSVLLLRRSESPYRSTSMATTLQNALSKSARQFNNKPTPALFLFGGGALLVIVLLFLVDAGPRLPIPKERDFVVEWEGAYGTSHEEMVRVTNEAMNDLRTVPGIDKVVAHLGRAVLSDKVNNIHYGEIWISMDDDVDYDETISTLQQVLDGYSNIDSRITTYRQQVVNRSLTGIDHMHAVRVYGENFEILKAKTEEVRNVIGGLAGIEDAKVDIPPMEPTIEIEVDLEKARRYGLKPGDVRRTAATLLAGIEVGSLFEGQKVFDVVVWGIPEVRSSISSVENLLIDAPDGSLVRISDVATIRENPNPAVIKREKVSQYIDITFATGKHKIQDLRDDINLALSEINFPLEYHAELVGEFAEIEEAESQALGILIAAIIGIFLLLQAALWSWRLALAVFPALLVSTSGGLLVALITGGNLSLGELVGLIAIFGLASYQGILLIKSFRDLQVKEGNSFDKEALNRGLEARIPAIVASSITLMVAFLPFIFFGNSPGMELLHPMSLVVIGGLITSLIVNLYVLPSLYYRFGRIPEKTIGEEQSIIDLEVAPAII